METRTKQDDTSPVQNENTEGTQDISLNCYPQSHDTMPEKDD